MKEKRHLKTIKNIRNLNTKWFLLQNDQNADTTLLHSHDYMSKPLSDISALNGKFDEKLIWIAGLILRFFGLLKYSLW